MVFGLSLAAGVGASEVVNNFDVASEAFFARMSTAPTETRRAQIDTLVKSLKTAGLWDTFDVFGIASAETSQAATLNLISTSYTATPVNSPTFTADRGYTGNGTTSYLNTGYVPSAATKATLNSMCFGVYINATGGVSSSKVDFGSNNATGFSILRTYDSANTMAYRVNQGTASTATGITNELGHTVVSRTASNLTTPYKNGTALTTSTAVSNALPTVAMFVGANNNNGTAANFANRRTAIYHAGSGLTSSQVSALYSAINTYLTAIGAA